VTVGRVVDLALARERLGLVRKLADLRDLAPSTLVDPELAADFPRYHARTVRRLLEIERELGGP